MNQKLTSSRNLKYLNLGLVIAALAYLAYKFNAYHHQNYGQLFLEILSKGNTSLLYVTILLVLLNYGIEAKKWQLLLSPLEQIKWINALKSILKSASFSYTISAENCRISSSSSSEASSHIIKFFLFK